MKKILALISLLFLSSQISHAQHLEYHYDAAGNRIQRMQVPAPRYGAASDSIKPELKDNIANHEIKLFPNPTKGEITVQLTSYENAQQSKIEVYDAAGKLVFSKTTLTEFTSIDLTHQLSGNYFLKIFLDGKMKEWKVLKTN